MGKVVVIVNVAVIIKCVCAGTCELLRFVCGLVNLLLLGNFCCYFENIIILGVLSGFRSGLDCYEVDSFLFLRLRKT